MKKAPFLHPIIILVLSILAVGLSLFLYIYWYVEASAGLRRVIHRANLDPEQVLASETWVVILVLSVLVGIILMGLFIIFVYNQKTFQLYRQQRNFINSFTHELRTPVASLKLYLETFRKYGLSREEQLKYIDYMIQDADQLAENISRILNLARIESKTYGGEFKDQDLVQVITRFHQRNSHLFERCEVEIENPSGRAYSCRINRSLFEMLLMNLFTNAIKHNTSGSPRLRITFRPGRRRVCVRFEDNGIGIPRSERKKVFRKFYQIGNSEDRPARGTGLGLHLVELVARIHKGRVSVHPGRGGSGSVFSVVLPCGPAVATAV
jgi:signal transduction histidine kinase